MLRLRLFKLMHECQTFSHRGCDQEAYSQMLWRLREWWQTFRRYEDDENVKSQRILLKMPLFCLRVWFRMTYIQLQSQVVAIYKLEYQETQAESLLGRVGIDDCSIRRGPRANASCLDREYGLV